MHGHSHSTSARFLRLFVPTSLRKIILCQAMAFFTFVFMLYSLGAQLGFWNTYFLFSGTTSDMTKFFPSIEGDWAKITWKHAVNDEELLNMAINSDVMFIEADILLRGQGTDRQQMVPIMAHPPATDSDLTFDRFIETTRLVPKGVKLDFKSIESVELCLQKVVSVGRTYPVMVNADILPGPNAETKLGRDPVRFLRLFVENLTPDAVLSVGWTTGYTTEAASRGYSWRQVYAMHLQLKSVKERWFRGQPALTFGITFPVRASLLGMNSLSKLLWLSDTYSASLTMWSAESDVHSIYQLLLYRSIFQKNRLMFDLPHLTETQVEEFYGSPEMTGKYPDGAKRRRFSEIETLFQPDDWESWSQQPDTLLVSQGAAVFGPGSRSALTWKRWIELPLVKTMTLQGRVQYWTQEGTESPNCKLMLFLQKPTALQRTLPSPKLAAPLLVKLTSAGAITMVTTSGEAPPAVTTGPSPDNAFRFTLRFGEGQAHFEADPLADFDLQKVSSAGKGASTTSRLPQGDKQYNLAILVQCETGHLAALDQMTWI